MGIDVSHVGQIIDGKTLATNALIERSGVKAALLTRTIDGFKTPVDLKVKLDIHEDHITCDFSGTSGVDKKGINVPLAYTKAYACYALKCCASIRAVPVRVHLPMA
ncbi:MAG: hydantoinase B/oxoprolinase family protein [Hyphomicrobiaceae bacterium]